MAHFKNSNGDTISVFEIIEFVNQVVPNGSGSKLSRDIGTCASITDKCKRFIERSNYLDLLRFYNWFKVLCEFILEFSTARFNMESPNVKMFCNKYDSYNFFEDKEFISKLADNDCSILNEPYLSYMYLGEEIDKVLNNIKVSIENDIVGITVRFNTDMIIVDDFYIKNGDSATRVKNISKCYANIVKRIIVATVMNDCNFIDEVYNIECNGSTSLKNSLKFNFNINIDKEDSHECKDGRSILGYKSNSDISTNDYVNVLKFNKIFFEALNNNGVVCEVPLEDIDIVYAKLNLLSTYIKLDYGSFYVNVVSGEKKMPYIKYSAKLLESSITNQLNIENEFIDGKLNIEKEFRDSSNLKVELVIDEDVVSYLKHDIATEFIKKYCESIVCKMFKYNCDNVKFLQYV